MVVTGGWFLTLFYSHSDDRKTQKQLRFSWETGHDGDAEIGDLLRCHAGDFFGSVRTSAVRGYGFYLGTAPLDVIPYIYICIYIDRQVDGWMDGWMEGWTDGWMDGCKDG